MKIKKEYVATARGKFKNENQSPVVGDVVQFKIIEEEKKYSSYRKN